ncbi:hypothetical protein [Actinosynnema sp. NPDC020468]|uniref:hypothetical protein n=1 Tax=Actinosynnema sp. NPDC020468 TaxID=3154488 RepID=UPI0034077036
MPRSAPSSADHALIASAAARGVEVTARQVERWRERGLVAPNRRRGLGRGRGSSSEPVAGTLELVVWLATHTAPGNRPHHLALRAFGENLAVPERTVRAAFESVLDPAPTDYPHSGKGLVPARVRAIDDRVFALAAPVLGAADDGAQLRPSEFRELGIEVVADGAGAVDVGSLAAGARALGARGAPTLLPHDLEHHLPQVGNPLVDTHGALAFLPEGPFTDHLRALARTTPLADLRAGWLTAGRLEQWALDLCAAVEAELASTPGEACGEWRATSLGVGRASLVTGVLDGGRPSSRATTALLALFQRDMIARLRHVWPEGRFDRLDGPSGLPAPLREFVGQEAKTG